MIMVGVATSDVADGREAYEIALLSGSWQTTQQSLGLFAEYIPTCVAHDSLLDQFAPIGRTSSDQFTPSDWSSSDRDQSPDSPSSEPVYGCSCTSQTTQCCTPESDCECVAEHGNFYDTDGRLQLDALPPRHVLVECSEQCACRAQLDQGTCANSVVRDGISAPLEVRPTRSSGLGLFSRTPLARGTFVCEFAGELISDEEASRRWKEYRATGVGNYILCINEGSAEAGNGLRTNIDPTRRGNIARFINHLCPPLTNLLILPVRCDVHLPALPSSAAVPPRAAIFAKRDIAAGEELGYDYADAGGERKEGEEGAAAEVIEEGEVEEGPERTVCRCGSEQCRGWLPSAAHLV